MACEPQDLITETGCLNNLLPGQLAAIQTYLLAVMADVSPDPATLLPLANCFACLNSNQLLAINTYLLCLINNNGGGGGGGGAVQVFPLTGSNTPAAVPTGGGIAYNEVGDVWIWNTTLADWEKIISA